MRIVFSNVDGLVAHAGLRVQLNPGEAWDAEDTLVQARPELFSEIPRHARRFDSVVEIERGDAGGIEEATKRPASVRTTKPRGTRGRGARS